jgi:xanthine dehydrogenase accessory factor
MKELRNIVTRYDTQRALERACVLATVVQVDGSSYRRPGARMLVLEDGSVTGAISGGCLEGDALKKALLTLSERKSRIVVYDTKDEDETGIGIQLGCEGVIHVLFEYVDYHHPNNPVELIKKAISKRQQAVLVTLCNLEQKRESQPGTCYLREQTGEVCSTIMDHSLNDLIGQDAENILRNEKSLFTAYTLEGQNLFAFIELIHPPVSLVIIGAGNDAVPVADLAGMLGWEVCIVDGRHTHARAERFTRACQVMVRKPEATLQHITLDYRTCVTLLTHNYQYDKQMMRLLLETDAPYIGMLGPRKKLERMLSEFRDEGFRVTDQMLSQIYSPIGLDIGAETPEEIAVSIIAEIQAVFTQKQGTMLKWKKDVIHSS